MAGRVAAILALVCCAAMLGCAGRETTRREPETLAPSGAAPKPRVGRPEGKAQPTATIGAVLVFGRQKRAEVAGEVCLTQGILDYLAVLPGSGKEYESLLILRCRAASLHAALLALGARPGPAPKAFLGDRVLAGRPKGPSRKPGDRVRLTVTWRQGGRTRQAPVEAWITDRSTRRASEPLEWIFNGSLFGPDGQGGQVYLADQERLAVALWYSGACVMNLAKAAGSPYRGERLGFEVNTQAAPKEGTPVRVSFHVVK